MMQRDPAPNRGLRRSTRRFVLVSGCFAVALAAGGSAAAATIRWSNAPISYTVVDQDLHDLLQEVGAKIGVPVQVSDAVKGHVRGRLPPAPARAFLDSLARIYGLTWYFDGATLYVSTDSETGSKLLVLGTVSVDELTRALDDLGVSDQRWPLRGANEPRLVMVDGPPRYIALVEQTLTALAQHQRPQDGQIGVFHGRVAEGRS